jgi:hypothetical protein
MKSCPTCPSHLQNQFSKFEISGFCQIWKRREVFKPLMIMQIESEMPLANVKLVDQSENMNRYEVTTDRQKRLLALMKGFFKYISKDVPDTPFESFHGWIQQHKEQANQLASVYIQEVVIKQQQIEMQKYVASHIQVFKEWGIDQIDTRVMRTSEHLNKTEWLPRFKQSKDEYASIKRNVKGAVRDNDMIQNSVRDLGELDVDWFKSVLTIASHHDTRPKKFLNGSQKRGKTPDEVRLLMLAQRSMMSLSSTWGIRGKETIPFNFNNAAFENNTMVYEYIDKRLKKCWIRLELNADASLCAMRHLAELVFFTHRVRNENDDRPFLLFYGGQIGKSKERGSRFIMSIDSSIIQAVWVG